MSSYNTVTVGNTATEILPANTARREFQIVNTSGSLTIFLGLDENVTTSNGYPLYPNQGTSVSKLLTDWMGPVYGITASSTADARFIEITSTG